MLPGINVVLVFLPVSLPLGLILAEAITTANVLATSEALIHYGLGGEDNDDNTSTDDNNNNINDDDSDNDNNIEMLKSGGKARSRKSSFFKGKYINMSGGGGRGGGDNSDDDESSEDSDGECMDEYQDEDIDERYEVGEAREYYVCMQAGSR